MPIAIRAGQTLSRRQMLARSVATCAVAGLGSLARPYLSRAADRPLVASGIQSGDVSANSAVIWARADRPARMRVECSTVESFKTIIRAVTADALPDSDFTSKVLIDGLPAGQDIFYRVRFDDISESGIEAPSSNHDDGVPEQFERGPKVLRQADDVKTEDELLPSADAAGLGLYRPDGLRTRKPELP